MVRCIGAGLLAPVLAAVTIGWRSGCNSESGSGLGLINALMHTEGELSVAFAELLGSMLTLKPLSALHEAFETGGDVGRGGSTRQGVFARTGSSRKGSNNFGSQRVATWMRLAILAAFDRVPQTFLQARITDVSAHVA
jgi:hypothetical protein